MLLPLKPYEFFHSQEQKKSVRDNVLVLKGFNSWYKFVCVVGVVLSFLRTRNTFTLGDLRNHLISGALSDEERICFEELKLAPKVRGKDIKWNWRPLLQLLRVLQAFRIVDLDLRGRALNYKNIYVNVLRPEWIPDAESLDCYSRGLASVWALFLRDLLPRRIIETLLKTPPGAEDVYVDLTNIRPSIYEQVLLYELRGLVQNWNTVGRTNYLGVSVGASNIKNVLKPISDVAMLTTLAVTTGIVVPLHNVLSQTVVELNKDFINRVKGGSFYKKFLRKLGIGVSWSEAIKYIETGREPEISIPQWQAIAFKSVLSS